MKKLIGILILVISINQLCAQGVSFGIVASPQYAWLKSDIKNITTDGAKMGINFGLNADFFFTENYAISTGLTINHTGGILNYMDTTSFVSNDSVYDFGAETSVKYKLQYLEIPLGLKFKTKQLGYFTYYGQFGLTGYVNVAARMDVEDYDISDAGITEEIALFNLGYHIGGGFEYSLGGSTAFTVGILYTNGFIDITSDDGNKAKDKAILNSMTLKLGMIF